MREGTERRHIEIGDIARADDRDFHFWARHGNELSSAGVPRQPLCCIGCWR
jgi:hypothetical protein